MRYLEKLILFKQCILDQAVDVTRRIDETRGWLECDASATPCGDVTGR